MLVNYYSHFPQMIGYWILISAVKAYQGRNALKVVRQCEQAQSVQMDIQGRRMRRNAKSRHPCFKQEKNFRSSFVERKSGQSRHAKSQLQIVKQIWHSKRKMTLNRKLDSSSQNVNYFMRNMSILFSTQVQQDLPAML